MNASSSARRRLLATALLLPVVLLSSCILISSCIVVDGEGTHWFHHARRGSGHRVDETRSVPSFSRVELDVAGDVDVQVGAPTSVALSGDDDVLPHVVTRVRNDTLHIYLDGDWRFEAELRIRVATPELSGFEVDGAGDVRIHDLSGDTFHASIDGAGALHADGSVRALHASIDGAGDMSLVNLRAESAVVSIDGAGTIRVRVDKELHYSIDGAGDIVYSGDPGVSGSIDGSGSVRRDDEAR